MVGEGLVGPKNGKLAALHPLSDLPKLSVLRFDG
jgi:hypothetical protein